MPISCTLRPCLSMLAACALTGLPQTAGATASQPAVVPDPAAVLRALPTTGAANYNSVFPESGDRDQHTGAPYFYVAGGDPSRDRLPLKETRATIEVAGTIAAVAVHQVFANEGSEPIEAVYVFPASTRAAVHAMRMRIGARTIEARVARRDAARAEYETAKRDGQRASLLEQERPNVFTTSVANIMPKDRIEVVLEYTEMLIPEDGVYELVYPTVVGPRYVSPLASALKGRHVSALDDALAEPWTANPHLPAGAPEPYAFALEVQVRAGIPIKEITSPSHPVTVAWQDPRAATVQLAQRGGGDRDFVLRYRLAGDRIETGVLLWDEPGNGGEHFFSLMLEPPRRPASDLLPRREYIFLLDVSGSMAGFPLDTAKQLMRDLVSRLRPGDLVNLALFAGASTVWSPSGSRLASPRNVKDLLALVDRQNGGGGTELLEGLQAAYRIPVAEAGVARSVIVITDGYVAVEPQAFRFIRERLDQANLFAFGIGSSVNRGLIEGMARAGLGTPFVVLDPSAAATEAAKLRSYVERPVLTDIQVRYDGFDAFAVAPDKVPDLLAERPLLLFGKFRPTGKAGRIEVTGRNGQGVWRQVIDVKADDARPQHAALRALWARKWIEILDDERTMSGAAELERAITELGLGYRLLTAFTSFVAIDSEVVNRGGSAAEVRQPLPMPAGVPNSAVGAYGVGGLGMVGKGGGGTGYGRGVGGLTRRRVQAPQVIPGQAIVRGSLDKDVIRRTIRLHLNEVRFCYEKQLGRHPELAGRVAVQFVISTEGKVTSSSVANSTLGNPEAETCIAEAVRRWEFPAVVGGGIAIVTYPFNLTPRPVGKTTTPIPASEGRRRRRRARGLRRG